MHKVPVHAGLTCPNRDGAVATGGCTYCNIDSFTPAAARAKIPIQTQVQNGIDYLTRRFNVENFIVYFQPYSNTYAPLSHLKTLYEQALAHHQVVGISVGTRPDCIDAEKLDYLEELSQKYFVTVEYGIESVHDQTLRLINRGHNFACTVEAVHKTAERGLYVCGHLILGFPNETEEQMFETAERVARLPLNFIKLHNLHVVRHTEMARAYAEKPFHLFTFSEWVDFVCKFLERLHPDLVIERLHGDAPAEMLIAPQWCRDGARIIHAIQRELENRETYQGKYFNQKIDHQNVPV